MPRKAENESERPETGYRDVSKEHEQAAKDAERPLELDKDGNPQPRTSQAAIAVSEEQSYRSAGHSEGGGPWPPELLRKVGVGDSTLASPIPEYTSHLDPDEQERR